MRERLLPRPSDIPLGDDLLWGIPAIAAYIKLDKNRTYNRARKGQLPTKRVGKTYVGSKSKLSTFIRGE